MYKPQTIWSLITQRPCAALVTALLIIIQAILNVLEVIILEHFIDNFSNFQWIQSVFFAIVISAIYAFYYIQIPLLDYLNNKICLQLRTYLERTIIEKTARVSVVALESVENQALLARLQDEPEKRYTNGFFFCVTDIGRDIRHSGCFGIDYR